MKRKFVPTLLILILSFTGMLSIQLIYDKFAGESLPTPEEIEHFSRLFQTERYETPTSALIKLKDIQAPVVVITFWASWCLPCLEEFKELEKFQKTADPNKFFFLGINQDQKDPLLAIKKIETLFQISMPHILDDNSLISKRFMVNSIPVSFIFVNGLFVKRIEGPIPFSTTNWEKFL